MAYTSGAWRVQTPDTFGNVQTQIPYGSFAGAPDGLEIEMVHNFGASEETRSSIRVVSADGYGWELATGYTYFPEPSGYVSIGVWEGGGGGNAVFHTVNLTGIHTLRAVITDEQCSLYIDDVFVSDNGSPLPANHAGPLERVYMYGSRFEAPFPVENTAIISARVDAL
jgi:hypothetical protein